MSTAFDESTSPNINKLIPPSINDKITDMVDGGQTSNSTNTTETSIHTMEDELNQGVLKVGKPHIGHISELAPEDIWNKHILTGYRINYSTWRKIFWSLFEWHNETINIWTHLAGFVVFSIVLLVFAFS